MGAYTWSEATGKIPVPEPSDEEKLASSASSSHPSKPLIYLQSRKIPNELQSPYVRPFHYPHVIDLSCFDKETETHTLTLADAIATIIFYHSTLALENFLDTDKHRISSFRLIIPEGKSRGYLVIHRKEREILCGYRDRKNYISGEQVTLCMEQTGVWKPIAVDSLRATGSVTIGEATAVILARARALAMRILRMQLLECADRFTYETYPKLTDSVQFASSTQKANW